MFFLFFLNISVRLVCYAHVFHVYTCTYTLSGLSLKKALMVEMSPAAEATATTSALDWSMSDCNWAFTRAER